MDTEVGPRMRVPPWLIVKDGRRDSGHWLESGCFSSNGTPGDPSRPTSGGGVRARSRLVPGVAPLGWTQGYTNPHFWEASSANSAHNADKSTSPSLFFSNLLVGSDGEWAWNESGKAASCSSSKRETTFDREDGFFEVTVTGTEEALLEQRPRALKTARSGCFRSCLVGTGSVCLARSGLFTGPSVTAQARLSARRK